MIYYVDIFCLKRMGIFTIKQWSSQEIPENVSQANLEYCTYMKGLIAEEYSKKFILVCIEINESADTMYKWIADLELIRGRFMFLKLTEERYAEFLLTFS